MGGLGWEVIHDPAAVPAWPVGLIEAGQASGRTPVTRLVLDCGEPLGTTLVHSLCVLLHDALPAPLSQNYKGHSHHDIVLHFPQRESNPYLSFMGLPK